MKMSHIFLSILTIIGSWVYLHAAEEKQVMQKQEDSIFVLAKTWFPPFPKGAEETKLQKLNELTSSNTQWVVWPMLTCIKIVPSSSMKFYTPGKKFSSEVEWQVIGADKQPLIYKGALLLEVMDVYKSYQDFVSAYEKTLSVSNMKAMSIFINFTPPDSRLQDQANKEKQTLVFVKIGPKILEGWPEEMKQANINFLKQILLGTVKQ